MIYFCFCFSVFIHSFNFDLVFFLVVLSVLTTPDERTVVELYKMWLWCSPFICILYAKMFANRIQHLVLAKGEKNHLQGCDFFPFGEKKKKNCIASEWGSDAKKNKCPRILHSQNGIVSGWFLSHKITSIVQKIQNPINFWQIKCPTVNCTQKHTRYTHCTQSRLRNRDINCSQYIWIYVCVSFDCP